MIKIGILHSIIREDERLIIQACRKKNIPFNLIDIRKEVFNPDKFHVDFDIALQRSISRVAGSYVTKFLENLSVPVINSSKVSSICEDKFLTSLVLKKAGVPTLKFSLAFDLEGAKKAIEELGGFPVVIKPTNGSWGRLMAKVNDMDCLESIIEHKQNFSSPYQKIFYIQEYVEKPGRDIRAFVIGGETICAIYRKSDHWITNTARGGVAINCPLYPELKEICKKTSEAIGGGILAIDIFETKDGLKVNEVNHTMEFKNSEKPTGVSISEAIVDYCLKYRE